MKSKSTSLTEAEHLLELARRRGRKLAHELLDAEGGALTGEEVGQILGLSSPEIEKRRVAGNLLAVPNTKKAYLFPSWQFKHDGILPGFVDVLVELRGHDAWAQLGFFLSGNFRLDGATPLEELRRGNIENVKQAASMYGEHGAA